MRPRCQALLSLLLLVPAPSVGAFLGMIAFPDSSLGRLLFGASKLWLVGLPLVWWLRVERQPLSLSPVRRGGLGMGLLSGVAISGVILGLYALWGRHVIDTTLFSTELRRIGLAVPWRYAAGATYWIVVNSVLEEYVWRWFCVRQCEQLWRKPVAIVASALFFTLHHLVAMSVYFRPPAVVICATGVFLGGVIWSWMYTRYRSIWPCYVSHAIVDLAIFGLGAWLLFG